MVELVFSSHDFETLNCTLFKQDILGECYNMVELIFSSHDFETLNENSYFNNFVVFFEMLCQKTINLFGEAGSVNRTLYIDLIRAPSVPYGLNIWIKYMDPVSPAVTPTPTCH